jgi:hypothetical protein
MSELGTMPKRKKLKARRARLIALHSAGGVTHRVKKTWRSFEDFRKESQFEDYLLSLAELPALEELAKINALAIQNELPEISRRAKLSRLEDEALALLRSVISSPERYWIRSLRTFLKNHGWKADLRGSPKKHPLELEDRRRGEIIVPILPRLKKGFDLKLREKKKPGYLSDNDVIKPKLRNLGYDDEEIQAILRGRELHSAACYYYRTKYEPQVPPKTILNSYRRFLKMKVIDTPR